jgi:ATP-dependent RNA helicase CshB
MIKTKDYIKKALDDLGFKKPTEVQEKVIPLVRNKHDVIGCSQTGSGKTHAFLIPIFEQLDVNKQDLQVMITAPTRELAMQIHQVARHIASFSEEHIDIRLFVGGSDRLKEINRLKKSQPMIAIGTPGKLRDLAVEERVLDAYKTNILVIDEADMALDTGFLDDIDLVAGLMNKDLQMMVFSATIPEKLRPFLRKYMSKPEEIFIKPKELSSLNIEHIFMPIKSKEKEQVLVELTKVLNPFVALIFCNTKETVDAVADLLYQKGLNVAKMHGDISPRERKRLMNDISKATYQYIVASDMASRGIDIDGVSHVINFELPKDMEFYVHRTGRTGRANYQGVAISLYTNDDDAYLDFLEDKGINIVYKDIKNGQLVEKRERQGRVKREKVTAGFNVHTLNVKKKKKVKPGYKKRFAKEVDRKKKKALRNRHK